MGLTASIAVNLVLAGSVIMGLVWLLAHQGIRRGGHHDRRAMVRMHTKERIHSRRRPPQLNERMTAASD